MAPILAHHDRTQVEVFCYSDVAVRQLFTRRVRSYAEHWRLIAGMTDEQVADRIHEDRIDLLIDLTMHMARNRMGVFARKPARVQATYLAYCSTTGLDAIDYRLTDPHIDPPGGPLPYVERSAYLPETYWCYEAPADAPPVQATPALVNGFITFGCLNNFCKVSPPALATWAAILRDVPRSRLLLHAREGSHRNRVRDTFSAARVAGDRIDFVATQPFADYLATYHRIDLALDPFPYGGGTTTLDGLWMGVPVVTLKGETAVGRGGVSILSNLQLHDQIAASTDNYMRVAIDMARNVERLNALRLSLRDRLRQSPLTNAPRFTRQLEKLYMQMVAGGDCGLKP